MLYRYNATPKTFGSNANYSYLFPLKKGVDKKGIGKKGRVIRVIRAIRAIKIRKVRKIRAIRKVRKVRVIRKTLLNISLLIIDCNLILC